jgi:hypothetical protein
MLGGGLDMLGAGVGSLGKLGGKAFSGAAELGSKGYKASK